MTDPLANWRWMLRLAREGEPAMLIEALTVPVEEVATDAVDDTGRRIWRLSFRPLPDDADLRREIVATLADMGRRGNGRRGRKRAIPARDAGLVLGLLAMLMADGLSREQAEAWIAAGYRCSVGTVQDVLRERKTYAPDAAPQKEARRLRGKITR